VFVAADIDGHVGVHPEFVREKGVEVAHVDLGFLDINLASFVHADIDDIALGSGGGGEIHFNRLEADHAQAREHEGRQQEEHYIDQRDYLDPGFLFRNWRAEFHLEPPGKVEIAKETFWTPMLLTSSNTLIIIPCVASSLPVI